MDINYENLKSEDERLLKNIRSLLLRLKQYFYIVMAYSLTNINAHYEMIILFRNIHTLRTKESYYKDKITYIKALDDIYYDFCLYLNDLYHYGICDPILDDFYKDRTIEKGEEYMLNSITDKYDDEKTTDMDIIESYNDDLRTTLINLQLCIEVRELWPRICNKEKEDKKVNEKETEKEKKIRKEKKDAKKKQDAKDTEGHHLFVDSIKRVVKHIRKLITKNEKKIATLYNNELKKRDNTIRQIQKDFEEFKKEKQDKFEQHETIYPSSKSKSKKPISKDTDVNKCIGKPACKDGKICNPKSGRCVNIDGSVGKSLQNNVNKCIGKPLCKEGFICNPTTGRCVKKDGKIGKSLL
jgi:hypothetical protein